jgi:nucleotide-binding universal stress UspA family protein
MFQTILVCTDGSEDAQHALQLTAELAHSLKSEIVALNVLDIAALTTPYASAPEALAYAQAVIAYAEQRQAEVLSQTEDLLRKTGATFRVCSAMGQPVHTITRIAEEEQAGLIVVGSHGLTGLKKFLLGSISDGVARYAHCPVLIVRGETTRVRQIVLASDGSKDSDAATAAAARLAHALPASLTVVHVVEAGRPSLGISPADLTPEDFNARLDLMMKLQVERVLHNIDIDYRIRQLEGHPAEAIIAYAEDHAADLIVIGSRGLGGFQRLLLGSVSDAVMHHAHCPVLIVR